ncbi:hypothetical protein SDC9_46921 [bioreactor metagenome]|uniref:HPt domain-containing protein n=1 Tax=bioreactor metagenome TaxID=1076179 RepID=A0A644WAC4_9ZZZZ
MATDPMAEIRAGFFVECEELLESLQDSLVLLQDGSTDSETVNTVFRAVHSIKGGAGAFGLDALVAFAHRYETVLDALRSGQLEVTSEAVRSFFQAADLLQDHVRAARDGAPPPEGAEEVLLALETLIGGVGETAEAPPDFQPIALDFQPLPLAFELDDPDEIPAPARWVIRFRPTDALYASGNEPLHLLRALAALGSVEVACDTAAVPPLDALSPEAALLAWRITLPGEIAEAEIREVFDFVEDVCTLEIARETGTGAEPPAAAPAGVPVCAAEEPATPQVPPAPVDAAIVDAAPQPAPHAGRCAAARDVGAARAAGRGLGHGAGRSRPHRPAGEPGGRAGDQSGDAGAKRGRGRAAAEFGGDDRARGLHDAHPRPAGQRDDDPRAAGQAAVPAHGADRARGLGCRRQGGAPAYRGRDDRGRQDGDRTPGRAAHPHDPQRRRPWAGAPRAAACRRQAGRGGDLADRAAPLGPDRDRGRR